MAGISAVGFPGIKGYLFTGTSPAFNIQQDVP